MFSFILCFSSLDVYANVLGRSPDIDAIILNIQLKIKSELTLQEQMLRLIGALDMVCVFLIPF